MMYTSRLSTHDALHRRSIQDIQRKVEKLAGKNELVGRRSRLGMRVTSNFASPGAWGFIAHLAIMLHMLTAKAQIDFYTSDLTIATPSLCCGMKDESGLKYIRMGSSRDQSFQRSCFVSHIHYDSCTGGRVNGEQKEGSAWRHEHLSSQDAYRLNVRSIGQTKPLFPVAFDSNGRRHHAVIIDIKCAYADETNI